MAKITINCKGALAVEAQRLERERRELEFERRRLEEEKTLVATQKKVLESLLPLILAISVYPVKSNS